ncbi:hypothetical protein LR48_Vigan347s001600 [Vigna angularis]|uniref:Uncharacterized protein n=1 Tax=Phaseolus angularis TaxID=3914 RepID=A0A0L9T8T3_PHAAN|nr:hypothetical protein LR48_Vigan347s001600 [Vigna angularis]
MLLTQPMNEISTSMLENGHRCLLNTMVHSISYTVPTTLLRSRVVISFHIFFVIGGLVTDGKFENVNSLQEAKSAEVLPFVACILKECKPNGLGDMQLTVKVHPFTTFRQNYYLNITHRSIDKVFPTEVCPPTIDLVKETLKPVIRLPMWAEQKLNVDDILRKFVPLSHQPATSKQPDNQ